jgi:hypothetical protein
MEGVRLGRGSRQVDGDNTNLIWRKQFNSVSLSAVVVDVVLIAIMVVP